MLRNILAAAWRSAIRDRLHTAINIGGLALGLGAAILIALFIRDELGYDRFLSGHDRVFRVSMLLSFPDRGTQKLADSVARLGPELALDFPEFDSVARIDSEDVGLRHGEIEGLETLYWADPATLGVLGLPVIAGDPATALEAPDSVVLTRSVARKYFGTDTPLGGVLEFSRKHPMRVTAVIEDLPSNTHLDIKILASARAPFSSLAIEDAKPIVTGSMTYSPYTYVRLKPGIAPSSLTARLAEFAARRFPDTGEHPTELGLSLDPLASIHLMPGMIGDIKEGGSPAEIVAMSSVGALILVIACINFINLMTARAGRRALEVGVRKALGASRGQLILQFIGEATGFVVVAAIVAIAGVELAIPGFDAFLDRQIGFAYWRDPALAAALLALIVGVGIGAGAYPSLVLAAFRPAAVLKGARGSGSGGALRQVLVILQFTVSIGLGIATTVILRQTDFATGESLRFNKDQMVLVQDKAACIDSFRDRVAALPGVRGVACSRAAPLDFSTSTGGSKLPDGREIRTSRTAIDAGFFELYGFTPLAGRFFDRSRPADMLNPGSAEGPPVVINEALMRAYGFAGPAAAIGQSVTAKLRAGDTPSQSLTVIGVVRDFPIGSIRSTIEPTVFYVDPASWGMLSIKLDGTRVPEDLAGIDRIWSESAEDHPIQRVFLDQKIEEYYRDITRDGRLFAGFAAVALVIGCLGLFGLSAFTAERRTKEIGIRKALGASTVDVAGLLVWQFVRPVLIANAIAWPIAWLVMQRWLDGFAYRIPLSWQPFALAGVAALVIAVLTTGFHAVHAARSRPITALRYE
jgi:putative ABC transport system permease protein